MSQDYLTFVSPRVVWSPPDPRRDRPIMGALLGQRATLIVETGASPAHALQFLRALSDLNQSAPHFAPAHYAVLTHWHWDHVFGTAAMGLPTISHVETRQHVQAMARLDWRDNALNARVAAGQELPFVAEHMKVEMNNAERGVLTLVAPEITFTGQMEVHLGDYTAQIVHVGGDHARDSSVIYAAEERVAFLGDCFYDGFIGDERFLTAARLLPLLDRLEALPVDYYILSHHPEPIRREDFLKEVDLMRRIGTLVKDACDSSGGGGSTDGGVDRAALEARLPAVLNEPVNEDHREILTSFIRGLAADIDNAY